MSKAKRGEIYYIERDYKATGSEQIAGRPAVIVSNDKNNENSATVEVVYLTTQPKSDLPTHVTIRGTGKASTALCEQITTVSTDRIGSFSGICSKQEMEAIDTAMLISLDITCEPPKEKIVEVIKEVPVPVKVETEKGNDNSSQTLPQALRERDNRYIAVKSQLELIQQMYSDLLKQTIGNNFQKEGEK